jgi:HEAT repeat protein
MVRCSILTRAAVLSTLLSAAFLVAGLRASGSGRSRNRLALAESRSAVPAAAQRAAAPSVPLELPSAASSPGEVRRVVRAAAAAGPGDVPRLRRAALEASDPLIAGNAIRALGRVGAAAADSEVALLLDDPRPRVRQEAVVALGSSGDPRSVVDLIPLLDGEDATMRALAIRSIGQIGGPQAREALERACGDHELTDVERAFLRQALEQVPEGGSGG